MAPRYDFAIFGTSHLAALLCGVLAHRHGAKVLRICNPVPHQRLPRNIDIALPLATRPGSWRLIRAATTETEDLLAGIEGQDRLDRVDVKLVADLPDTTIALAHLAHIAAGYGYAGSRGVFRGISRFSGDVDLAHSAVQTVEAQRATVAPGLSGASLNLDNETVPVGQIVLADDAAILALLPEPERPAQLVVEPAMATLTVPARRLPARIMRFVDRGVTLMQKDDRSILALVAGRADAEARLASCLAGTLPLQRRATTHYRRVTTADGAPLIGRLEPSKLFVVAGLSSSATFLAPPIARLLADAGTEDERKWFLAHDPASTERMAVADIAEVRR